MACTALWHINARIWRYNDMFWRDGRSISGNEYSAAGQEAFISEVVVAQGVMSSGFSARRGAGSARRDIVK